MNKIIQQILVLKQYVKKNDIALFLIIVDYALCRIFCGYCLDDYIFLLDILYLGNGEKISFRLRGGRG